METLSKTSRLASQVRSEARRLALVTGHAATHFRGWRRTELEVEIRTERLVAAKCELTRFRQVQRGLTAAAERVRSIVARRLSVRKSVSSAGSRSDRRSVARSAMTMFGLDVARHLADSSDLLAAWRGIGKRACGQLSLSDRQWGLFEALIRDARIWRDASL